MRTGLGRAGSPAGVGCGQAARRLGAADLGGGRDGGGDGRKRKVRKKMKLDGL
jgi:hypothetical protein